MSDDFSTRGGCVPVVRDADDLLAHTCNRPQGGDKTIQVPEYALTVINPTDSTGLVPDFFENEEGSRVIDDANDYLILNA